MLQAETASVTLVRIRCGGCGLVFAIPDYFKQGLVNEGRSINCPNRKCSWGTIWWGEGEKDKLKKQVDNLRRRLDWKDSELKSTEYRRRAAVGQATKLRKKVERTEAGVCPHCQRSFKQLRRHMRAKHGQP